MNQKDAVRMICEGVIEPVAKHIGVIHPRNYCIHSEKYVNEADIDPEIISYIINTVKEKIKIDEDYMQLQEDIRKWA